MAHFRPSGWDQDSDGFSTNLRRVAVASNRFDEYGFRPRTPANVFESDATQAWYFTGTADDEFLHGTDYTLTGTWSNPNARTTLPLGDIDIEFHNNGSRVEVPWFGLAMSWFYNTGAPPGDQNLRVQTYSLSDTLLTTHDISTFATFAVSTDRGVANCRVVEERCSRFVLTHINRPTSVAASSRNPMGFALQAVVIPDFYPNSLRQRQTYTNGARQNTRRIAQMRQRQITP